MFSDLSTLSFTLDVSIGHGLSNDKHNDKSKLLVSQINLELLSSKLAEVIDADDMNEWNTLEMTDSDEYGCFSGVKSTQRKESIKATDCLYNDKVPSSNNFTAVTDKGSSKDRSRSGSTASRSTLIGGGTSTEVDAETTICSSTQPVEPLDRGYIISRQNYFAVNHSHTSDSIKKHFHNSPKSHRSYAPSAILQQQHRKRAKEALCPPWAVGRTTSNKLNQGTVFVLKRHPQYLDVLEVIDLEDKAVAYRKISRSGNSWRETFHDVAQVAPQSGGGYSEPVAIRSTAGSQNMYDGRMLPRVGGWDSESYVSASTCEGDSFASSESWSLDSCGSGIRPTASMLPVLEQHQHSKQPQQSLELRLLNSPSIASAVSSTSSSERSLWKQQRQQWQTRHPQAFDAHELWEISSPCPNTFPLHCRDTRGTIDPVRLTPMVLDRHQFCYRFHLAGKKMRWLFKNQGRCVDGLQCYVRSTIVAQLLFGGHSAKDSALDLDCRIGLSESDQQIVDNKSEGAQPHLPTRSFDSHHPQIIIFPAAYTKLAPIDCAVVESFVLFTGIEVFECFLHDI
ncbi:hypothetical protein IWW48_005909 [Coemansia sp. RSA 1200]|nr:hypothetical protein IWW48_005909 [Coemansia sp. RSA 1200]